MTDLAAIEVGKRYSGIRADAEVTVIVVERNGESSVTVTYRDGEGRLDERVVTADDAANISEVSSRRWSFDADGAMFRLASEARRMKHAHLADPFAAVDTSNIEPYPHQIDAVYNRFLEQKPLRFLLADDPGAGKTIMSGLLIRELMLRGDVARCLIVAPGSLVEQWQDEMWDKFGLHFDLMSRASVEESRTGNPFLEKNMLVARVDQLARSEELTAKVEQSDWDLIIVDEAHKMSAQRFKDKLNKTKRFALGEVLRDHTRHFLLLSATPHNGKNEDFLAFMTLIDEERFAGQLRGDEVPDVSDVMRRLVKENLLTFDGKRLFPTRTAETLRFKLSGPEQRLYDEVTEYVKTGMNRADRMREGGDKRRGLIVGFALAGLQRRLASSPDAIYHSLRRRTERLDKQSRELRRLAAGGGLVKVTDLPKGIKLGDLEDFDYDDYDDAELEDLENAFIDAGTAAATADELAAELVELRELVRIANDVRNSGVDTKWLQLRDLLRSDEFREGETPRKLIIFSEHKDTLHYVANLVVNELGRPEAVVTIHGGIKRHDRREIQDRFRVDPTVRVLVATDAAGEGVNLQTANLMVNYDLPWNPNRLEQRFGRIHRIGQKLPCHLWNLVAHETREGMVFERLFEKIEQQRGTYGDQVYDVLGDPHLNVSLQELLIKAIREDDEAIRTRFMDEVIDSDIGNQLEDVLRERALVGGLGVEAATDEIRDLMERAKARRLQPGFVGSFFKAGLELYGGRITKREADRFEITRVPAAIRTHADRSLGHVHDRYSRITFDKRAIQPDGEQRAELVAPGTPLLAAVVDKVLLDHADTLQRGATLVAPDDDRTEPRLLVYIDHTISDGRWSDGHRQVVSRRFQYVEIDSAGNVTQPGDEPYIAYAPPTPEEQAVIDSHVDDGWADRTAENDARNWAIENLAGPHFAELTTITKTRVAKVRAAVRKRLESEILYWDRRTEEIKEMELAGKKPPLNSGNARARADDLEARLARRRLELDLEENLHNSPPTITGAALVVPQGFLDLHQSDAPTAVEPEADKAETDRRGVAAVMDAERSIGRVPTEMPHHNIGFDIDSVDPVTGIHYFIEVKSHLPRTEEIHVSAPQVQKSKSNPDCWRLAVASVPDDPAGTPLVRYLVDPFADTMLNFAQTGVPLKVATLLAEAGDPQ
ncbi:MAG: helicase-related protein [Ilumatobacter sp.]|uniref:helicase-related protein n=1 Tax=Ilumatobacter sp. TaxID=1967498 RepID=UPI003296912F